MSGEWVDEIVGSSAVPESLRALIASARACRHGSEVARLVAEWMATPEALTATVTASVADPPAVEALLLDLQSCVGGREPANRLRSVLRAQAKARRRSSQPTATLPNEGTRELAVALDRPDLSSAMVCPPGWALTLDGLHKLRVERDTDEVLVIPVSARPLFVAARLEDISSHTVSLRVEWLGTDRWHHRVVPRRTAMDRREVIALASYDVPVTSNTAGDVVQFLSDQEQACREALPTARVASHMGWQGRDGADGFLLGRTHLVSGRASTAPADIEGLPPSEWDPGRVHLLAEAGYAAMADGFRLGGTWEGWLAAVAHIRPYPVAWLPIYAALLPPLMRHLPQLQNFVLDLCGATSVGKTTCLRGAVAVWGEPDERGAGLLRSWDVTPVWFERTAAFLHDLPMVLDDTKRAIRPDQVGRMLYAFANGLGRGRGSLEGTRDVGTWRSVLISSGETPATSFTEDGGTRARTLCVWGSPFGETSEATSEAVRAFTAGVTAHYGHAGHRLLRWLLEDPNATARLRAAFDAHVTAWTKAAGPNGVAGRMALYVAGLATAADVLHQVLMVPRPEGEPIAHAWDAALRGTTESDRPLDALRFVVSWAAENRESFFEARKTHERPPTRWFGAYQRSSTKNRLSILPHLLTGVLTEHGYDAEAILRAWDERGWLAREKDRREVKVVIDEQKERCVSINELGLAAANGGADA